MTKGFRQSIFLTFLLSGCTVGPVYETPDTEIPCDWHSEIPLSFDTIPSENLIWWESCRIQS